MIPAVWKFETSNKFSKWEQTFYSHQLTARAASIFQFYHVYEPVNERQVCVIVHALSEQHMQRFMEDNGAVTNASGLHSWVSEFLCLSELAWGR